MELIRKYNSIYVLRSWSFIDCVDLVSKFRISSLKNRTNIKKIFLLSILVCYVANLVSSEQENVVLSNMGAV